MSETNYFWQGGRKISIEKDDAAITLHAATAEEAAGAAAETGVLLRSIRPAAPGLVRADTVGDREQAVDRLRAGNRIVHHVYRDRQAPAAEYLITDTFFVKFKPGTPPQRIRDYLEAEHLVVERDIGDNTYLVRVTTATGRNPIRTANAAASRADVEYAEPNLVRQLTRFAFIPTDELFVRQWHLHAPSDGPQLAAGAGIFAAEAWDITRGSREVVIAVADDGFDLSHPDFQGKGKIVARLNASVRPGTSALAWDEDVSPRVRDYHGTPCMGVAVAEGNGSGVVGVAPGCALVAVRFPLVALTDEQFVQMFEKISPLADVVSCSWGVGPTNAPMSLRLREGVARLARAGGRRGKGLIFCVAAGNNNCPIQDLTNQRTYRYRDRFGVVRSYAGPIDRWIAAHPDVITVSASTSLKTRAAYSSWGRQVSVCAPSDNWDDLGVTFAPGLGITTTDNPDIGPGSDFTPGSRFTDRFGGTSSATPTVAGVCGLVISANPTLTAAQVRELIQQTADKDLSLVTHTPVNEPGEFDDDGFSLWFGHGKVNAFRAVQGAAQRLALQGIVKLHADQGMEIGDLPVLCPIVAQRRGVITDFRVQLSITHPFAADLRVDLITPSGTSIALQTEGGRPSTDLIRAYSLADTPALRALLGRPIEGTWQLRVLDTQRFETGRLNEWRIVARTDTYPPKPKGAAAARERADRDELLEAAAPG